MSQQSQSTTYIGIALYAAERFPVQRSIILSTSQRFDAAVWCATVIETVNGRVASWKLCDKTPATFEPYLTLMGIITVMKVKRSQDDIIRIISTLGWNAQDYRDDFESHEYAEDYVRRVLLHLCSQSVIRLSVTIKRDLDWQIELCFSELRKKRHEYKFNQYPVIPLMLDGDIVFGQTVF
jgi:hypothetical protein